jgi:hypothetical protein
MNDEPSARFSRAFALGPSIASVAAQEERRLRWVRFARASLVLAVFLTLGTFGYWYLGESDHTVVEALYMTVISVSAVGFTEVIPITNDGMRIFTMALILLGGAAVVNFLRPSLPFSLRAMSSTASGSAA